MKNRLLTLTLCLFIAGFSTLTAAQQLLLTNGTLLDPSDNSTTKQHLLLDQTGIIARLDQIPADFTGQQLDISGKFVIPGLIDMHTHAFGNRAPHSQSETMGPAAAAQVVLHAGVTGFVDLFGNEEQLFEHRRLQRSGLLSGADIYTSLSCLTAPGGHCSQFGKTRTIADAEQAKQHIGELAAKQADVIKLVSTLGGRLPSLSPELLKTAADEAKKHGIKTIVHIHTLADIDSAIAAGADAITHLPDDGVITIELAQRLASHQVVVIPTLACDTDEYEFMFSDVLQSTLALKVAAPRIVQGYQKAAIEMTAQQKQQAKQRTEKYYQSIKNLIAADVALLTGTDAGNYGTLQGFSVHREMEKFAAAGLSNWQALASATSAARQFLAKPASLQPGAQASLVILNSSPIDDIRNSQQIFAVVHQGKLIN